MKSSATDFNSSVKFSPSIESGLHALIALAGNNLVVGAPLGVGKPNVLLNALWQKARDDKNLELHLFTALSLALPKPKSFIEKRFLLPFLERHFGTDYPELEYLQDVIRGTVPENAELAEFYMQSGMYLGNAYAQRHYTSSNYTHVPRDMADRGVNVIVQLVGVEDRQEGPVYSSGSNPDTTQDLLNILERRGLERPTLVAVVNRNMPFMTGKAEIQADYFDLIIDDPDCQHQLFAPPIQAINLTDHAIGLQASTLIADGGTLQIGIGSLSDALVQGLKLRHTDSSTYRRLITDTGIAGRHSWLDAHDQEEFSEGLYAASEMFMDGFMHLYKAGILTRSVWPDVELQQLLNQKRLQPEITAEFFETLCETGAVPAILDATQLQRLQSLGVISKSIISTDEGWYTADGQRLGVDMRKPENRAAIIENGLNTGESLQGGAILHAAFFLGSKRFYAWLHSLEGAERELFQMTSVSQINELYGGEALDRAQRIKARFVNTTMKVTLLGAAASDGLENNQVVSGVGGQYNFVAMAQALPDSRSILMLRSTHGSGEKAQSNIVWSYAYDTIPRHLRDIVISEYGIAVLRGKSDEDCVKAMLCIADSRFQTELMKTAKHYGKLKPDWQIPAMFQDNTPAGLKSRFADAGKMGLIEEWPFGSDFTDIELRLIKALVWMKQATKSRMGLVKSIIQAFTGSVAAEKFTPQLERMGLTTTHKFSEMLYQKLLLLALDKTG